MPVSDDPDVPLEGHVRQFVGAEVLNRQAFRAWGQLSTHNVSTIDGKYYAIALLGVNPYEAIDFNGDADLFLCLANRRVLDLFTGVDETRGIRPQVLAGVVGALHKQNAALLITYQDSDGHLGVRVVDVAAGFAGGAHRAVDLALLKLMSAVQAETRPPMPMHDGRVIAVLLVSH